MPEDHLKRMWSWWRNRWRLQTWTVSGIWLSYPSWQNNVCVCHMPTRYWLCYHYHEKTLNQTIDISLWVPQRNCKIPRWNQRLGSQVYIICCNRWFSSSNLEIWCCPQWKPSCFPCWYQSTKVDRLCQCCLCQWPTKVTPFIYCGGVIVYRSKTQ